MKLKTIKAVHIYSLNGFNVGEDVKYKGKIYKIHSFPFEILGKERKNTEYCNLRKYRKDGLLDSRSNGLYVKTSELQPIGDWL